jgi:hypothetical protein
MGIVKERRNRKIGSIYEGDSKSSTIDGLPSRKSYPT